MNNRYTISYLSIDMIKPNPYQPRRTFNKIALDELSNSIKEHGIIQPILVRKVGNLYELVTGERRLKAAKISGLNEIPAIILQMSTKETAIFTIMENLQRQDLNFMEELEAYQIIIDDYG